VNEAPPRVSRDWLALREPADAAARARDLAERLATRGAPAGGELIHDLGGGTGSMGRWLAPLLPGRQHWVVHERDAELLKLAAADLPGPAADGAAVTVETRCSDIFGLDTGELAGATLITASALLDMLTGPELAALVTLCVSSGCPVLLALSVVGRVELTPAHPLDGHVAAAFNAHQRRRTERGPLLGPDAAARAADAFARHGFEVLTRHTPWRLGAGHRELAREWLAGWVAAACEHEPALVVPRAQYARRRRAQLSAGELAVTVHHTDLLVLPARRPASRAQRSSACAPRRAFVAR
jgi:hypothetical protein